MKKRLLPVLLILSLLVPLTGRALFNEPVHANESIADASVEPSTTEEEIQSSSEASHEELSPVVNAAGEAKSATLEGGVQAETASVDETLPDTPTAPLLELELLPVYETNWTNQPLEISVLLVDKKTGQEVGINKLEGRVAATDDWTDITGQQSWTMRESGTLYLRGEASDGQILTHELAVSNIDTEIPMVHASIDQAQVAIRATDDRSGVAIIYVNDYPFADVKNGNLNLLLQDYDTYFETLFIQAVDLAGNRSLTYHLKNPYYRNPVTAVPTVSPTSPPSRPADIITPSPVTEAKGTLTNETTTGQGTFTENTVIPVKTSPYQAGVQTPEPVTTPAPTEETVIPDPTRPPRTDTDQEPTITGSADQVAKEFLSVKTKSGKIFYLIIDRTRTTDNVYLVTEVDEADLMHFTNSAGAAGNIPLPQPEETVQVTLPKPSEAPPVPLDPIEKPDKKGNFSPGTIITILLVLGIAAGGVYYLKVLKPKQQYPSEADFFDEEYMDDEPVSHEAFSRSGDDDSDNR